MALRNGMPIPKSFILLLNIYVLCRTRPILERCNQIMTRTNALLFLLLCNSHAASFSTVHIPRRTDSLRLSRHATYMRFPRIPFFNRPLESETTVLEESSQTVLAKDLAPTNSVAVETIEEKELSETEKLLKQVKDAGLAGVISYAAWELGFWTVSLPVVLFGYYEVAGHWPDLSDKEDVAKLGAEAFAFVNFARFAVPLRIGLALSTTPWIQDNIVDRFLKKEDDEESANGSESRSME